MKKIKIASLAFVASILGFTSCSNDVNGLNPENETGEKTYMSITLDFPQQGSTRASADVNGTEEEAAIKTVDIFICLPNNAGLAHHALTLSDFTPVSGSNKYTAKTKIPTTTGDKFVYAGVNLPAGIAAGITKESDLKNQVQTLTRVQLTDLSTGIPMFSKVQPATFVAKETDAANKVTLQAKRMVAKVTVEKSATLKQDGIEGTLGELEFAVNNFNNKSFLVQGANPEYRDPNWDVYTEADFESFDQSYTAYAPIKVQSSDITKLEARYAAENTSKQKRKKEITRVTVRSTFIPKMISKMVADKVEVFENTQTEPLTFWAVTEKVKGETHSFHNEVDANKYADLQGVKAVKYIDGLCYWDLFLNKGEGNTGQQWDVVRNEFFRCNISRIVAPGRETPELPDGEDDKTPDSDTNIFTDIEVLNWNTPVLGDYELIP